MLSHEAHSHKEKHVFPHRPDFAPQSSDEEDEDMESHIQNRLGQPSSRDIDMTTAGAAPEAAGSGSVPVNDRRLRRLQDRRKEESESDEEEEDRQARWVVSILYKCLFSQSKRV